MVVVRLGGGRLGVVDPYASRSRVGSWGAWEDESSWAESHAKKTNSERARWRMGIVLARCGPG